MVLIDLDNKKKLEYLEKGKETRLKNKLAKEKEKGEIK